ncbi:826_t:CDS:1, partial [Racocetra persica]
IDILSKNSKASQQVSESSFRKFLKQLLNPKTFDIQNGESRYK